MSDFWLILVIVIGVVALFVAAMSITLIFKGHNIKSEIGDNEAMRQRGIKCVLEDEHKYYSNCASTDDLCPTNHGGCGCHSCGESYQIDK